MTPELGEVVPRSGLEPMEGRCERLGIASDERLAQPGLAGEVIVQSRLPNAELSLLTLTY